MFVPDGFEPPLGPRNERFLLEPLGPQHNERDHAAWMSSIEHIRATPGFGDPLDPDPWPEPMTLAENLEDMHMHARHFHDHEGFTYTVLDPATKDVIGCVYIYPVQGEDLTADVRSWVRSSHADLDAPLWRDVSEWIRSDWPFAGVHFAAR